MRNIFWIVFASSILSGLAAPVNKPFGFRDLTFGQSREKISGLSLAALAPKGETHYYKRDSDSLSIEDQKATFIVYGFKSEALSEVFIGFNPEDEKQILAAYTKLWGDSEKKNEKAADGTNFRDTYLWKGDKVVAALVVTRSPIFGQVYTVGLSLTIEPVAPQSKTT
jgi:hypothetical protein